MFGERRIYVRNAFTGNTITMDVATTETIDNVKARLVRQLGIEVNYMHLMAEVVGGTVSNYELEEGSTLYLVKTTFCISVKAKRDVPKYVWSLIKIEVEPSSCIGWLKERIQEATGIPPAVQRLTFDGTQLEDDRTISSYNMQKDSKIKCMWDGTL